MHRRPSHYERGGRGVPPSSAGKLAPWLGRVVVASIVSLAPLPALAANPPDEVAKPLLTQITASEYEFTTRPDGSASAPNRAHGLRSTVSPRGFAFGPRTASGAEDWVGLHMRRAGTAGALVELAPGRVEVHGDRATVRRAGTPIVEWVENRESGLEHGFTIAQPIAAAGDEPIVIELGIESRLRPQIGSTRVRFRHPDRAGGFGYGKLHAFDAAGTALPVEFAAAGEGALRVTVQARGAQYPITIDPVVHSFAWDFYGDQDSARLGAAVATAGDVNDDGYSDVVVGAPDYDLSFANEGAVFLFLGSPTGLAASWSQRLTGNLAGARFGSSLSPAGDLNGDGRGDLVVGAPTVANGHFNEGRFHAYLGQTSSPYLVSVASIEGDQANAALGSSVAAAGDVDGDGYDDVVVGAPGWTNGQLNEGRAFLHRGTATGLAASASWTAEGNEVVAGFGTSVSGAFDVNGDGYDDVVVGCPSCDNGQFDEGRIFVYHGLPTGLSGLASAREGDQVLARFGSSVAGVGDSNGDGYADVLVGEPFYDVAAGDDNGRVALYLGSSTGIETTASWTSTSASYKHLGRAVAAAGDRNGDGYADLLFSEPTSINAGNGLAYVVYGTRLGPAAPDTLGIEHSPYLSEFGAAVASAGDVNGDGLGDVVVGAPALDDGEIDEGAAFVDYGQQSSFDPFALFGVFGGIDSDQAGAELGAAIAYAGDVNGDGYSDLLVSAPRFDAGETDEGRVSLYLGQRGLFSTSPAWSVDGNAVSARLGEALAPAADVNGDGYDDFLIGAPAASNGQSGEGRAFLYAGAASPPFLQLWSFESNQASASLGHAVAGAGDVNGDGYADIAIGAPFYDGGQLDEGRVLFFFGAPLGPSATPAWTIEGNWTSALFGRALASGDVDRDGLADLLVGAPYYDAPEIDEGRAYLYRGTPSGPSLAPVWSAEIGQADARFGFAITATDVNGDGFADAVIGAPGFDGESVDEGRAFAYHGSASGLSPLPDTELPWPTEALEGIPGPGAHGGAVLVSAGDTNGDGYGDILVGSPDFLYYSVSNNSWTYGGGVLYRGSASGLVFPYKWLFTSQVEIGSGRAIAGNGDYNGDGYADIALGFPELTAGESGEGAFRIYPGNMWPGEISQLERRVSQYGDATRVGLLGRSDDATGIDLIAIGRTPRGRGEVRMRGEAQPLDVALGAGSGTVSGWFTTNAPGSTGSYVPLGVAVDGLDADTPHHWRLRIESRSPFFPNAPWFSPPGNTPSEQDFRTRPINLPECNDDKDNDADEYVDAWRDDGCTSPGDPSERVECEDGLDNDGDGWIDVAGANPDPGCHASQLVTESPQCSDGIDNEGDLLVDFPSDPHCTAAWDNREKATGGCGLGAELVLLLSLVAARQRLGRGSVT